MTATKLQPEQIVERFLDLPVFAQRRIPKNEDDFGDEQTIGLSLKLRDGGWWGDDWAGQHESPFAIYLGGSDEKGWVIAYKKLVGDGLMGGVSYPTLQDLKQVWGLD